MSTHVVGIKPPDEKYKKMLAVYRACVDADLPTPQEVSVFFNYETPEETGVRVKLDRAAGVTPWRSDGEEGFEIELAKLDPTIKFLRVYNSY